MNDIVQYKVAYIKLHDDLWVSRKDLMIFIQKFLLVETDTGVKQAYRGLLDNLEKMGA